LSAFPHASSSETTLDAMAQKATVDAHRAAAILIGQKKYSAGIRALQAIVHAHEPLAAVHYQLGALLLRMGRLDEAIQAFDTVRELRPDATAGALALADALMHAGRTAMAREQADVAIALAEHEDVRALAAAHEMAARAALADKDSESATRHAAAAHAADNTLPVPQFVRGRLLYDEGQYEEAAAQFSEAEAVLRKHGGAMADLHLYLGESLARLDRYADAEAQFREELQAYPRNVQAYTSLAMLYRASNRAADVEDILNELVAATPTPEGYAVAARLWTILGERSRAEALRSDARARFRGDPSLAQRERDGRR
jgi:tetratricopeptide (TPR) repeat protein